MQKNKERSADIAVSAEYFYRPLARMAPSERGLSKIYLIFDWGRECIDAFSLSQREAF